VRERDEIGLQMEPVAHLGRERQGQTVVSALDPIEVPACRRTVGGELIDQRNQRQFLRVGEEEPPQAACAPAQLGVGVDIVEPGSHRSTGQAGRERRIPAAFREPVEANGVAERAREAGPPLGRVPADDVRCLRAVGLDHGESAPQDALQGQAEFPAEGVDLLLVLVDEIAPRFGVLMVLEPVAHRPDAAPNPVARVHDGDVRAEREQVAGGGEPGESGTGHEHGGARKWTRHPRTLIVASRCSPSPAARR
jgi:hypothetical protein